MNIATSRAAIASDTAQWRSATVRTGQAATLVANTTIPPHQFQGLVLPPVVEYGRLQDWFVSLLGEAVDQGDAIADALEEVLLELQHVDADVLEEFARLWWGRSRG